jgi:hypothetical protein
VAFYSSAAPISIDRSMLLESLGRSIAGNCAIDYRRAIFLDSRQS